MTCVGDSQSTRIRRFGWFSSQIWRSPRIPQVDRALLPPVDDLSVREDRVRLEWLGRIQFPIRSIQAQFFRTLQSDSGCLKLGAGPMPTAFKLLRIIVPVHPFFFGVCGTQEEVVAHGKVDWIDP